MELTLSIQGQKSGPVAFLDSDVILGFLDAWGTWVNNNHSFPLALKAGLKVIVKVENKSLKNEKKIGNEKHSFFDPGCRGNTFLPLAGHLLISGLPCRSKWDSLP